MMSGVRLGLGAALAVWVAVPASAVDFRTTATGQSTDPYFGTSSFNKTGGTYAAGQQQDSGPGWSTSAYGQAELGRLKVASSVAFQDFDASGGANSLFSLATASYTDQLFLPPPPSGAPGKVYATITFKLTGDLGVVLGGSGTTGDSRAFIRLETESILGGPATSRFELQTNIGWDSVNNQIDLFTTRYEEYDFLGIESFGDTSNPASMFGTFDWKFRVGFSDKRKITATMGCLSYVSDFNAGSNNAVSCNLGNSFDWVGITFTDENGDPVITDPITSASGQNYNVAFSPMPAVPEPASWAMMIAGFGLIGAASRRRRLLRA